MSISTNNLAVTINFYIPAKYVGWALPTKTRIWWADVGCVSALRNAPFYTGLFHSKIATSLA